MTWRVNLVGSKDGQKHLTRTSSSHYVCGGAKGGYIAARGDSVRGSSRFFTGFPSFYLAGSIKDMSGCIKCWFLQCVANPIPLGPGDLWWKIFLLCSCTKFSVADFLWPVYLQDLSQTSINEGSQLVWYGFCHFPGFGNRIGELTSHWSLSFVAWLSWILMLSSTLVSGY